MAELTKTVQMRFWLRQHTASSHDRLDSMAGSEIFAGDDTYARFLCRQYAARLPIERWVSAHCPGHYAPPPMTALIAADLAAMKHPCPPAETNFKLPEAAHPLGLAWAIAGSHLGNRMMLRSLQQCNAHLPATFLSDETMGEFWRSLKGALSAEVDPAIASHVGSAAEAVFAQFLAAFADTPVRRRAA